MSRYYLTDGDLNLESIPGYLNYAIVTADMVGDSPRPMLYPICVADGNEEIKLLFKDPNDEQLLLIKLKCNDLKELVYYDEIYEAESLLATFGQERQ